MLYWVAFSCLSNTELVAILATILLPAANSEDALLQCMNRIFCDTFRAHVVVTNSSSTAWSALVCRLVALNLTVHGMLVVVLPLIRLMVVMSISNGGAAVCCGQVPDSCTHSLEMYNDYTCDCNSSGRAISTTGSCSSINKPAAAFAAS